MRYHQSITIVLAVFCVSVFLFAGCGQKEEKKQSMPTETKGEKAMAAQYSFDFPALSDEHIRQNYEAEGRGQPLIKNKPLPLACVRRILYNRPH